MSSRSTTEVTIVSLLAALAMVLFLRPIWDIDIFWHIAAGRWMVANGTIPYTDIFGIDPERPWISIQWGYQVLVYYLDMLGGFGLLRATHAIVMALAFAVLYWGYRRYVTPISGVMLLWLCTLMLYGDRINVRPHVFNLLGLALLVPAFLGAWRTASNKALAGWVGMFLVWANLHAGGALVMLVALLAIPIGASLEANRPQWRRAWGFWGACFCVCALSPRFISGLIYTTSLLESSSAGIAEWSAPLAYFFELDNPTPAQLISGAAPYVTLVAFIVLLLTRQLRDKDLTVVGAALALTGLSLIYIRFVYLVAPVWMIMARWNAHRMSWSDRIRDLSLTAAAVVVFGLVWHGQVLEGRGGLSDAVAATAHHLDPGLFPVEGADFLETVGFEGTVFCNAGCSGYMLWRLHPKIRTIVDGRFNVDTDTQMEILFVSEKYAEQSNPKIAEQILGIYDRYSLDALVLARPGFGPAGPNCKRWLPVFRSGRLAVYYRNDDANAANLKRLGLSPGAGCPDN